MAITLERPAFYENKRYAEYCGLSTDNKADIKANNADEFYEIDTGDVYKYAEGSGWIKQANQGGGEVNQNAFSNVAVKKQSEAVTAVAGQADDATIAATAKTDTITMATGNKWVDVNGTGKTITVGHALSGVTAGATGDASHVAKVTVDAAGHVTAVEAVAITPAAIGAAELGQTMDDKDTLSLYGVKALATQASADAAAALDDAKTYVGTEIGKLDVDDSAVAKQFVSAVSETDGKITVTRRALIADDVPELGISKISGLQDAINAKQDTIAFDGAYSASNKAATVSTVNSAIAPIKNDITDLQTALIGVSDLIGGDA